MSFIGSPEMTRIFFSNSWKLIFDLALFFTVRFICTHIIAYKHPDGIIWPDPAFYSITNTSLPDNQYQVSSYSGILMLGILYWIQEGKLYMIWIAVASLVISINLELSYRISYCTGTPCSSKTSLQPCSSRTSSRA